MDPARARLASQRLGSPLGSPGEVVRWMGAVQAQDRPASLWALALRMRAARPGDVERAVERGDIVRTWPMRGTLHWVPGEDARWMLDLLAARAARRAGARHRELGLDAGTLARSGRVLERALAGGARLTRAGAYATLERAGIATRGQRGIHILAHHAQRGLLCLGPMEGKQPTFVLLDALVPRPRSLAREEALAEVARRYATGHGPATAHDLAWWAGLPIRDARAALGSAQGLRCEGEQWRAARPMRPPQEGTAHLLPAFDEMLVGYRDRAASAARLGAARVPRGAGLLRSVVVLDGQVAGLWGRTLARDAVRVRVRWLARVAAAERGAVEGAAERYAAFLGKRLDLRFRAPTRTSAAPRTHP